MHHIGYFFCPPIAGIRTRLLRVFTCFILQIQLLVKCSCRGCGHAPVRKFIVLLYDGLVVYIEQVEVQVCVHSFASCVDLLLALRMLF